MVRRGRGLSVCGRGLGEELGWRGLCMGEGYGWLMFRDRKGLGTGEGYGGKGLVMEEG